MLTAGTQTTSVRTQISSLDFVYDRYDSNHPALYQSASILWTNTYADMDGETQG